MLTQFKNSTELSGELSSVATLTLLTFKLKLTHFQDNAIYSLAVILDPKLNKLLPKICERTSWNFNKVTLKIWLFLNKFTFRLNAKPRVSCLIFSEQTCMKLKRYIHSNQLILMIMASGLQRQLLDS